MKLFWIIVFIFAIFIFIYINPTVAAILLVIGVILLLAWMIHGVFKGVRKISDSHLERKKIKAAHQAAAQQEAIAARPRLVNNKITMKRASDFIKNPFSDYVAFDLETTGLSQESDAIVEIGAVRVSNGNIAEEFQQMVNPEFPIPDAASAVNHITDQMVANAPLIGEAVRRFLAFVGDCPVLVAHNAKFDSEFLTVAADREGVKIYADYFDTLELSQKLWPNLKNHKLGTVSAFIHYQNTQAHRALDDARAVCAIIHAASEDIPKQMQQKAEEKEKQTEKLLSEIKITETDRKLFGDRCPLQDVQNLNDSHKGYEQGSPFYYQGDLLRKAGQIQDAILLFNKARYYGYDAPALYEGFALAYRKMKDYQSEIELIDEYLLRNPNLKKEKFLERKQKAKVLLDKESQ